MTFMYEGGLAMWMTLALFVGAAALTVARRRNEGWRVGALGAVAVIASGLAGFATGLYNTVAYAGSVASDARAEVLGLGLRESVHNVLWAGVLAFALAALATALGVRSSPVPTSA